MYNEHFGLQQAPFRITPDTRLFYEGGGRGEILDALVYAIVSGEGIVKVVGEVGTGKTMLCRMLEERLPDNVEIVYLANPSLKPDDILQAIALEMNLEIAPGANRLKVMHAMQQRLLEKHAANRQVVVFVEEAQSMPLETLEEIRLLSNLETKREKLLQIVLFGQPELDENLNQPNIRQLKERITHSFYLEPLNRNELRDYVNFRMRAVGYKGPDVFRSNAYVSMTRASEGLTRRINILADKALLAAYANDRHEVKLKDVRKAINDSQFEARRQRRISWLAMFLGALLLAGAAGWGIMESWSKSAQPEARPGAAAEIDSGARSTADDAPATTVTSNPTRSEPPIVNPAPPHDVAVQPTAGATASVAEPQPTQPADPQSTNVVAELKPRPAGEASTGYELMASAAQAAMRQPRESFAVAVPAAEPMVQPSLRPQAIEDTSAPAEEDRGALVLSAVSAESKSQYFEQYSDLMAARLKATRQWLARANDDHYSIQLLLTAQSQRWHVEKFLQQRSRAGEIDQVYVYETVIDDRPYLGVLYREFSGYSAAKRALDSLPAELKRLGPFIRNLRDVASVS